MTKADGAERPGNRRDPGLDSRHLAARVVERTLSARLALDEAFEMERGRGPALEPRDLAWCALWPSPPSAISASSGRRWTPGSRKASARCRRRSAC